ncbi:MAG TPA: TetR/AcrR family transcriptional regulator [Solirubrobacteraceae bacterium]|jgi:AcrR family transcriptional regulator|nr:TetR/AcrR family transcriptional regulator [Solirubrobacteraceae bacterium]
MTTVQSATGSASRAPRRLSREARREQLVESAMPVVAEQGFTEFSLDEVAARADVTRNLLYHYFPRGRPDLALAIAERAGHEITDGWLTDETIPIEERVALNNTRIAAHALQPSDAWRINRLARSTTSPEIRAVVERFVGVVVANMSLNHLGTPDPPPLARLALSGYLAFVEAVLDDVRTGSFPPDRIVQMLNETLAAALEAAGA